MDFQNVYHSLSSTKEVQTIELFEYLINLQNSIKLDVIFKLNIFPDPQRLKK